MTEQSINRPEGINWKIILIAAAIAALLVKFLFRELYCFYTFQFPAGSALTIAFGALSGILGYLVKSVDAKFLRSAAIFVMALMITLGVVMIVAPFVTDLNKNFCVKDFQVLVEMIEREGGAVITKDINTIHEIYDPSAVISRVDTTQSWQAYVYYTQKFASEEHCQVNHLDYLVEEFSDDLVRMTTGSRGSYGLNGQGCTSAYANPSGSDAWTFQKINGTWKIVYLEFNRK